MFSSPCSLRSSSCAALIALAAAAGISRFEPAPSQPTIPFSTIVRVLTAAAKCPPAPAYPLSLATCLHTSPIAQAVLTVSLTETFPPLLVAPLEAGWPLAPSAIASEIIFFAWVGAMPTVREHSHPYAVGPPRRGLDQSRRAAGHAWPGDSSARRCPLSRIAQAFISAPRAPLTRTPDSGPSPAGSLFPPGSALRGEPESPSRFRFPPAAFSRARRAAAILLP